MRGSEVKLRPKQACIEHSYGVMLLNKSDAYDGYIPSALDDDDTFNRLLMIEGTREYMYLVKASDFEEVKE